MNLGQGKRWRVFVLLAVVAAIFLRMPMLLLEPRFWAEEATQFFGYAWHHNFLESLLHLQRKSGGYFVLSANIAATAAARVVPLEYAPFVTTLFCLFVMLLPFCVVLWGKSYLWSGSFRKLIACAIFLFAPSATGEVWLNTINLQVYTGLLAFCLACEDLRDRGKGVLWSYRLLLVFCGLSGIYATFLFPVFVVKAYFERSRESYFHLGISLTTSILQFSIFVFLRQQAELSPKKFVPFNLFRSVTLAFYNHMVVPIAGPYSHRVASFFGYQVDGLSGTRLIVTGCISAMLYLFVLVWLWGGRQARDIRSVVSVGFVAVSIGTCLGSVGGVPGGRYGVLPGFLFLSFLAVNCSVRERGRLTGTLCSGFLIVALITGLWFYRSRPAFTCPGGCPVWQEEVARWREDPEYRPAVWPNRHWHFQLLPSGSTE